jgi:hypothetical protein
MRSNAGVAKQTEKRRLAQSASLRSQLALWLVAWFGSCLVECLVGWFPTFCLDCFTLENYMLSRNVSTELSFYAAQHPKRVQTSLA